MKELGLSLSEIHKLLGVLDKDEVRCTDMYDFVCRKLEEIQRQMKDLKRIENMLNNLKERCSNEEELYDCPVIETLIDGDG